MLASVPSLLSSSSTTNATNHLINILQTVSLILYYPLENLSYLSSKGVFPLSPARELAWSIWSCRFWAAYVVLDVWRLVRRKRELQVKAHAIRLQAANGEKDQVAEQVKALQKEKTGWLEEVVINVYVVVSAYMPEFSFLCSPFFVVTICSGYAPLTIHWSLPNGAWSNEASSVFVNKGDQVLIPCCSPLITGLDWSLRHDSLFSRYPCQMAEHGMKGPQCVEEYQSHRCHDTLQNSQTPTVSSCRNPMTTTA